MIVGANPLLLKKKAGGIPQDFIHYYSFDNVSGTTVIDNGSAGIDGTANLGVTLGVSGLIGNAASFDGSNNANIIFGSAMNFWGGAFSYHCLVFADSVNRKAIFTAGTRSLGGVTERVLDFGAFTSGDFYFVAGNGSSYTAVETVGSAVLTASTWHMVSVKWDGTTNAGGIKVKIDNVEVISGQMSGTPSTTSGFTRYIGGRTTTDAVEWDGLQDETLIYGRFTSDAEDTLIFDAWGI